MLWGVAIRSYPLTRCAGALPEGEPWGGVFKVGSRTMRMRFSRTAHCHPDRAHKGEWSGSPKPQEAVLGMMYAPDFFERSVNAPTTKKECSRVIGVAARSYPLTRCAGALPKGEPWGGGVKACSRDVR